MRYILMVALTVLALQGQARGAQWQSVGSVGFDNLGGNRDNIYIEVNDAAQVRITLSCAFLKPSRYMTVLTRTQWKTLVDGYFEGKLVNQRSNRGLGGPAENTVICRFRTKDGGEASIIALSNHEGEVVAFQLRAPSTPPDHDYVYAPRVLIAYDERSEEAFEELIEKTDRYLRRID